MKAPIILLIVCIAVLAGCQETTEPATTTPSEAQESNPAIAEEPKPAEPAPSAKTTAPAPEKAAEKTEPIRIANWNIQRYAEKKAGNEALLTDYSDILSSFDIAFVQEVQNENAFEELCYYMGDEYDCMLSSPAGTTYKEMYGLFYKKDKITVEEYTDLQEEGMGMDGEQLWMRPPVVVTFNASGYVFTVWNIHIKPDNAEYEIGNLYSNVVAEEGKTIVMGDFNADCSYFKPEETDLFTDWYWIIGDDEDTTLSNTDCAYDRIIANPEIADDITGGGVYTEGITEEHSDHYVVWAEINGEGKSLEREKTTTKSTITPIPVVAPTTQLSTSCTCLTCTQIKTCTEAKRLLNECGCNRLDGDKDGTPCETLCK